MNSTPEWDAIDFAVNASCDHDDRTARQRKAKRRLIAKRAALAVISAVIGFGTAALVNTAMAPDSDAVTQTTINQYIRANGGIPPCKEEDGSGQPGKCYWDAAHRGDGNGHPAVLVPVPGHPGADKTVVWLDTHNDN
jgi:hypothetical protein